MARRLGRILAALTIGLVVMSTLTPAFGSPARPPRPGPDYHWVSGHWVHVATPANTVWVAGHTGPNGGWVPGHFKYVGPPKAGHVWVVGHWEGTTWVPGYFRFETRSDRVWVAGHYGPGGGWVRGHWKYTGPAKSGHVWVAGHWQGSVWVSGTWRPASRRGKVWVPGHYGPRGKWRRGHWKRR